MYRKHLIKSGMYQKDVSKVGHLQRMLRRAYVVKVASEDYEINSIFLPPD